MIHVFEDEKVFHLFTDKISYVFHVENNSVRNIYYGKAIDGADAASLLTPAFHSSFDADVRAEREEYALWNGHGFHLPCLQVRGESGRALFAAYKGCETKASDEDKTDQLDVILEDTEMALNIRVRYLLYRESGIIARSVILSAGEHPVTLDRVMSAAVSLPFCQESKARWLTGKWSGECRIQESSINTGVLTLQSKRGITGPHFNPAIALAEPAASENNGNVWFGALAYSGNWSIQIEKTIFGNTHIVAGINDFDFEMKLEARQSFQSPIFYIGFTDGGFGEMSRIMHNFVRDHIMPKCEPRPVLYNSWEATAFNVQVDEQKKLADRVARIGCELFVVDDGWFGERHSDKAGLGDWQVNPQKFPKGLGELADYVTERGMRFGIWVEPESVNPDSDLYRAHPDWIYRYPHQKPVELRNQYLLNMSLPQVQDYLRKMLHDLLSSSNITFIKWDMNRVITDPQSAIDGAGKSLWYNHIKAVYALWEDVRKHFPHVEMETCSGGGGRIDLGILRYAEQSWPSDNTDPYTRLFIQEGYTQFYPANAMMCWVTDSPGGAEWAKRPLSYRFHSAMCGGLGIGSDITKFSEAELDECAVWIKQYKRWRHIIQRGALYRLVSPRESHVSSVEYVSQNGDEAVIFVFANGLTTDEIVPPLRLCGLDATARYKLDSGAELSGATLMNAGLQLNISGDFASRAIYLKKYKVFPLT
ncbi:MAG: alpha-galactosidase [Treponema sp.]|jgi:alpha-galactosidase|nr:alpha-galactosidase [Treponema sp.]